MKIFLSYASEQSELARSIEIALSGEGHAVEAGQTAGSLGLDGTEVYDFGGLANGSREATVTATSPSGKVTRFKVNVRVDTPKEWEYMENGGILHFVLRQLAA